MSLTALFKRLGAPLANSRWSWGAVRSDGVVFLRVWSDETRKFGPDRYVRLVNHLAYEGDADNLGYPERVAHVALLAAGAQGYAIMCTSEEPTSKSRKIASYDDRTIIVLGEIAEFQGDEWAMLVGRVGVAGLAGA